MPYTQADLDAIDAEIATIRTTKSLTFADRSVVFRNLDELYAERARIALQIESSTGGSLTRFAATSKGL